MGETEGLLFWKRPYASVQVSLGPQLPPSEDWKRASSEDSETNMAVYASEVSFAKSRPCLSVHAPAAVIPGILYL